MATFSLVAGKEKLFGAAVYYEERGFSVIPVWGDIRPTQPKTPAIEWKMYQYRRANSSEFADWFSQQNYSGLALVTGTVSRLVVLDFDQPDLAEQFAARFPHLAHTRTVHSAGRDLPHYYYRIPAGMQVASRRAPGVDLLAEGRYVIAPPTTIAGKAYRVTTSGQPMLVTAAQIAEIQAFIDDLETAATAPAVPSPTIAITLSAADLVDMLRQSAVIYGRNEALFRTACAARDAGWLADAAAQVLLPVFIPLLPVNSHQPETVQERQQEGLRTIVSVWQRAPRNPDVSQQAAATLPNALREYLLQAGKIHLARVLDGLFMSGMTQNASLTEKEIVDLLAGQVGRYSILKALQETDPTGNPVFAVVDPSPTPLTHTIVASANAEMSNNKCLLFRATASNKIHRGRPPKTYRMPAIDLLCSRFGVRIRGGDMLQAQDLRTPASYRSALQRELIRRRPGMYALSWLAQRLGISRRTVQRYQSGGGMCRRPTYAHRLIGWSSLASVPDENTVPGMFLQDENAKRYPAVRAIAARLLKLGRSVACVRQGHNYYWHPDQPSAGLVFMENAPESRENAVKSRFKSLQALVGIPEDFPQNSGIKRDLPPSSPEPASRTLPQRSAPLPKAAAAVSTEAPAANKRRYRLPLPDLRLEEIALTLYERIRRRCQDKAGYLSKARARWLVDRYGHDLVRRVLGVLRWRDGIDNPAGFVTVWLRSERLKLELIALQ